MVGLKSQFRNGLGHIRITPYHAQVAPSVLDQKPSPVNLGDVKRRVPPPARLRARRATMNHNGTGIRQRVVKSEGVGVT